MDKVVPVTETAEAFVELLNANGVEYLFLNPGTASAPIQEAIAKYKAEGRQAPEVIISLLEFVAATAAHGHAMVSGKPQAALVHFGLGTSQTGGALLNAQRDRVGMVLCATRVPLGKSGGRTSPLSWFHEQYDQSGTVRDRVKWDYELRSADTVGRVVQRAFRMASSEPAGPVYLTLPQDILTEKMKELRISSPADYATVEPSRPDDGLLDRLATMLLEAEDPLIITGYAGRNTEAVEELVSLAETVGARVVTAQYRMNFPTSHPLCGEFGPVPGASGIEDYLEKADMVLIVDCDVPYLPARVNMRPDVKIAHLDIDPLKNGMPMWDFPADILAGCDAATTLPLLTDRIKRRVTPEETKKIRARTERLHAEHKAMTGKREELAAAGGGGDVSNAEWVGRCLDEVIGERTVVIEEAVTNRASILRQINRTLPGTYFSCEGQSLGWSLPAAFGAKLAKPESEVVAVVGDGTFIFGCPIPTLWASSRYDAPFLTVVLNNGCYTAPKNAIRGAYGPEGYSVKSGEFVGCDFESPPDYAKIAEACGGYGIAVSAPGEVKAAIETALAEVKKGRPAVVDVLVR